MKKLQRVLLVCQQCSVEFEVIESRVGKAKYCSHKCYELASIGRKSWNKGINIHSEEERVRRSESMLGCKNPMYGKKHIEEVVIKMRGKRPGAIPWNTGKKFPGMCVQQNRYGENNPYVKHTLKKEGISYEDYLMRIDDKELYYRLVDSITKQQQIHLLEYSDKRGKKSYHLDHIYPVSKGFKNKIPPEIIGDLSNLRFIPWLDNLKKADKLI